MSGLGDSIGDGGDPGSTGGRFDPGQVRPWPGVCVRERGVGGVASHSPRLNPLALSPPLHTHKGAGETGNAPLNPDPRHTPGCGFDPATGMAQTAFAQPDAGLGYDPVTQTVAVYALAETDKDALPINLPPGYAGDHTRVSDLPHNAPSLGEEEVEEKKE